jgi:uncharacterized protein YcfJ
MHAQMKNVLAVGLLAIAAQASAQATFYEADGFQGRSFTTERPVNDLQRLGFNDRASSVVVSSGRWEVCEDAGYGGRCVVLRQGQYPSLGAMGLNDRVSSVRSVSHNATVNESRYAPPPAVAYDYRRHDHERLYQANVTSARAVFGTPVQRCWMDREQVVQQTHSEPNVGGAVVGAMIGGILGHQVGSGRGQDLATAVGAVGGAAVGANAGRNGGGSQVVTQDVQRCTDAPGQAGPEYWDVTYNFRGHDYRMQTITAPGSYVTVNRKGEPRV